MEQRASSAKIPTIPAAQRRKLLHYSVVFQIRWELNESYSDPKLRINTKRDIYVENQTHHTLFETWEWRLFVPNAHTKPKFSGSNRSRSGRGAYLLIV